MSVGWRVDVGVVVKEKDVYIHRHDVNHVYK